MKKYKELHIYLTAHNKFDSYREKIKQRTLEKLVKIGFEGREMGDHFIYLRNKDVAIEWGWLDLRRAAFDFKEAYIPSKEYINTFSEEVSFHKISTAHEELVNLLWEEGFDLYQFKVSFNPFTKCPDDDCENCQNRFCKLNQ